MEQEQIQNCLRTKLAEAKARNPSYTVRSFAMKLGISSGALSEILNGRRRVSVKFAERLAKALMLDPQQKAELFAPMDKAPKRNKNELSYLKLTADQFHVISEWQHFALVSLMKTINFNENVEWIGKRLGLSKKVVGESFERLHRLGLIAKKNDKWKRTQTALRTTDDVSSISVRKSHFEDLELARKSLEQDPMEVRDFTSITMAIDSDKLPQAKQLIRDFQDRMSELLETSKANEVYKMTVYLYPLTKNIASEQQESKK